jgi:SAM-dependent methyltransferase
MGWYRSWFGTPYYALLYGHRDERDARRWVDAILERWQLTQGSRVLDMACGRGRHARWFASCGMSVTGIDISADSIAQARIALPEHEFHIHDMREPFATERFDAVVCLFTSLGYFETMEEDLAALRSAFHALKPGGVFMVDFMNTSKVLHELVPFEEVVRTNVLFRIQRSLENGIIVKRIEVTDGQTVHTFEERVQALLPEDIERLGLKAGFLLEDRTDGPVFNPYDRDRSDRCVTWFKRPIQ